MKNSLSTSTQRGKGFGLSLDSGTTLKAAIVRGAINKSDRLGTVNLTASAGESGQDLAEMAKELFSAKRGAVAKTVAIAPEASEPVSEEEESKEPEPVDAPAEEIEPEVTERAPVEPVEASATVSINASQLESLLSSVENMAQELTQTRSQLAEAQAAVAAAVGEAQQSQAAVATLNRLATLTGVPMAQANGSEVTRAVGAPAVMRYTNPAMSAPGGAYGNFARAFDSAPGSIVRVQGENRIVRDFRGYVDMIRVNRAEILEGLQSAMRAEGLLSGGSAAQAFGGNGDLARASTTVADVASQFLPKMSALVRMNNTTQHVWHNWIYHEFAYGQGAGHTMQFAKRGNVLRKATNINDRLLSSGNVFVPISTNTQPVQAGMVPAMLKEWGLGRATIGDPLGFVAFVERYSLMSLIGLINDTLVSDFYSWRDLAIRSVFRRTSRVAWNKNGVLVDSPASLAAGDGAELTADFLVACAMYLETLGVPSFNGFYVAIVPSSSVRGFIASVDNKLELVNEANQQIVRNVIATHSGENDTIGLDTQLVSGLVGIVGNVIVIRSNAYGVGAPGSEGVQSETIASASRTTRSGYVFGAGVAARGVGMPFEIRASRSPFEREERLIWLEHSETIGLDVDSLNSTQVGGEDTRVLEIRVTDGKI
jgi:hypothetical protein